MCFSSAVNVDAASLELSERKRRIVSTEATKHEFVSWAGKLMAQGEMR